MKIIIILFAVLIVGAGSYWYLAPAVTPVVPAATTTTVPNVLKDVVVKEVVEVPAGEQCIGTACSPKTEVSKISEAVPAEVKPASVVKPPPVKSTPSKVFPRYTDFVNPSGFINSEQFTLSDYIGKKIILVEFITYTCINCQRTFPYLKQWHETYEKDGLLVVGIHTPEFAYEKDRANVVAAMKKEGITFPVVMDNDYATWSAYQNHFWPHRYLIDYAGNVVFDYAGEGAYAETEKMIQSLLGDTRNAGN